MSDPQCSKVQREQEQVRTFLVGRGLAFDRLDRGADPPDLIVSRAGMSPLGIEVTEYHPEGDRVGMEKRASQFCENLNGLIAQLASLKGVLVNVTFQMIGIPSPRYHEMIAEEATRCMQCVIGRGWVSQEWLRLSFMDYVKRNGFLEIEPRWVMLAAEEWPVLAKYVSVLEVRYFPFDGFMQSSCFQAQAAYCSPYSAAFARLLAAKDDRVRKAIVDGRYATGGSPLWLLIVSNRPGDLSSFIFGDWQLKRAIQECGFDFAGSPFDEAWLMAETLGGASQRLYPWDDHIWKPVVALPPVEVSGAGVG